MGNCTACEVGQYGAVFEVISSGQCSDEAVVTTADVCAAAAAALAGAKTEQHNAMSGMYHYGSYGSGSAHVAESAAPGHVHVISAAYYPRGCFIDDDGRISFNSYSNSAGSASGVHGSSYGSSYGNYGGSLSSTPSGSLNVSPSGHGGSVHQPPSTAAFQHQAHPGLPPPQQSGFDALNRMDLEKRQQVENTVLSFLQ